MSQAEGDPKNGRGNFVTAEKVKKLYTDKMILRDIVLRSVLSVVSCVFVLMYGSLSDAVEKDGLDITRDKDKTAYSIGSSENRKDGKTEEERDKEQAWGMLNHMNVIVDQRGNKPQEKGQQDGR